MGELELTLLLYGLLVGLGAGLIGGLLAGLAGVGGGMVYVPLFYFLSPAAGEAMATHVFASMVAVLLTGVFSTRAHWRLGHIDTKMAMMLLPGLTAGAAFGLWSTLQLPPFLILLGLTALNAWVAFDYGRTVHPKPENNPAPVALAAWPIGYLSGMLGIGGGTMSVPLLRRFVPLRHAVGTSAVCGLMMVLSAVLLNLSFESDWAAVLSSHWLFLMGSWTGIILILPAASGWSSRLHDSMGEEVLQPLLKSLFAIFALVLLAAMFETFLY